MWPYIEVVFFLGILICSGYLAESNGIKSNSEIPSKRIGENDPKSLLISDSGLATSASRDIDAETLGYSDSVRSESSNRDIDAKDIAYSDSVRSESSNRDIDAKDIGYSDSVRSENINRDIDAETTPYSDSDRSESDADASDSETTQYSNSDQSESDNDASDAKTIDYSDSDRSESSNRDIDVKTIGYDTGQSESDNVESDFKTTLHSDRDRSESDSVTDGHAVRSKNSNDRLSSTVTSRVRLNAISEMPTNYGKNEIKDVKDFSTPQRNGRQKKNRSKHRRERLRLNKEQRDVAFFEPIRMPQTFEEYDHNGDGYISLRELVDVTGAVVNAKYAFSDSDNDNNGKIDEEEFNRAPWDLSGQVERVKHKPISSEELL